MRVREIMSAPAVSVPEGATLESVARRMLERKIGCVPVVGADGRLSGIITESDFAAKTRSVPFSLLQLPNVLGHWLGPTVERAYQEARTVTAREVMTTHVVTVTEKDTVEEAIRRMYEHNVHRLPVVRDGIPIGVVTRQDLLRLLLPQGRDRRSAPEFAVVSPAGSSVEGARRESQRIPSSTNQPVDGNSAVKTREFAEQDWVAAADQFSRLHKGQLVTVETFASDLGAQSNLRDVPLMGITLERAGPGHTRIVIAAGDSPGNAFAHVVDRPSHVRIAEWNDTVSSALQIESADGVTLVRVGPAGQVLPPGMITDGVILPPQALRHMAEP